MPVISPSLSARPASPSRAAAADELAELKAEVARLREDLDEVRTLLDL